MPKNLKSILHHYLVPITVLYSFIVVDLLSGNRFIDKRIDRFLQTFNETHHKK